jgi:metal-dependent amidase/aminoacylase/carboxypeptidase family protein
VLGGALAGPQVALAYGLHLWADLPTGKLAVAPGPVMAAVDDFARGCEQSDDIGLMVARIVPKGD